MSRSQLYVASSSLPVSIDDAFAYHDRPGALQRLIPPWESVEIESSDGSLSVGSRVVMRVRLFGVPLRWIAEHTEYDPPRLFCDTQISGPFKAWTHRHEFRSAGRYAELNDRIEYQIPMGAVGGVLGGGKVRATLEAMFAYRHRVTRDDLTLQADRPCEPMTVAVSGSSGLVGSQLSSLLTLLGHRVRPLVRHASAIEHEIAAWGSEQEAARLAEVDAVVHLAGKSIADQRWNDEVKEQIRESRISKTRQLCESLAKLPKKPAVFVCASATGIYGDRGDERLDEQSAPGNDFLADVAREWEQACQPAVEAGIRVVQARFGIILSSRGGALQKLLLPAKFAAGAMGSGKQWWSWIALDDAIGAIVHTLTDTRISGPVNFVSPQAVTNREFAGVLGSVIGRPAIIPAPAPALRLALGEMADSLLLCSARVAPRQLTESGYRFRFPELDDLLRYSLGYARLESAE